MTVEPPRLPRLTAWLLRLLPLGDRRADVEADLAELFGDRVERYGRVYAHRRLYADLVSLMLGTSRGSSMFQDVRFGVRLFRKHPLPIGITIGGLALAIGVVTSVFSLVNASMLQPYGMDEPSSVVSVRRPVGNRTWPEWSYTQFLRMRREAKLSRVEATLSEKVRFSTAPAGESDAARPILFVSGGYLQMLGGRPALGRALEPADDLPGAPAVVVVSHYFWTTQLNGNPSVVGTTVWLSGAPAILVGVLQPSFTGPTGLRPSFWAPLTSSFEGRTIPPFSGTTTTTVEVVARLAPGSALPAAQEELAAIVKRSSALASTSAANTPAPVVRLYSAASPMAGPEAANSYVALACIVAVVGLVLALACANTANLLLAGAATRMREMGVRLALGSTRGRLVRQLMSESLLLGLISGGLGLLLAVWFVPVLGAIIALPPDVNAAPDGWVLLFTVAVAIVCGIGAGISPARYGARGDVLSALKSQRRLSTRTMGPSRFRSSLVAFQAAVSMLLLVIAALLAHMALVITRADTGFDANKMLAVSLDAPRKGFDEAAYSRIALAAVRAIPSVERASLTQYEPFGFSVEREDFTHEGLSYMLYVSRSDADYFATAGLRILRGRGFTDEEVTHEAPVALIGESVAHAFFQGTDPIGQSVSGIPTASRSGQEPARIIGVVADAMVARLESQSYGTIYRPISQTRSNPPSLIVRTASPGTATRAVEEVLRRIDPRVRPTTSVVREGLDEYLRQKQMLASLSGLAAVLALVLAILGVYGVTAFAVSQRTQEVSVRMAIGASTADVLALLVKESLRPVVIGLAFGLGVALVIGRMFATLLPGISPHDPLAIGVAVTTLLAGALAAIIAPARRVARTDPASVLRQI